MRHLLAPLLLSLLACTPPEGSEPGHCADALDNDNDGLYDCDDPDCAGAPDCQEADADIDTDTDTDTDTTRDTGPDEPCGVGVDEVDPADGSTDAYYRGDIEFLLDDPDPTEPTISLVGPSGAIAGSTSLSEDREQVRFEPNAPLEPLSAYTATLDYCTGLATVAFTTSELGLPCHAPLGGRTYVVDRSRARVVTPPGIGELFNEFVAVEVLVAIQQQDATTLSVLIGAGTIGSRPVEQDLCHQTMDLVWDWSEAPAFDYGAADVSLVTPSGTVSVTNLAMSGAFSADGSWFGGGELELTLDMRDWVHLIDEVDSAQDICMLGASFGAPCVACDDGQDLCQVIQVDRLTGEHSADTTVEPVDAEGHPDCTGPTTCGGCSSSGFGPTALGLLASLGACGVRRRQSTRSTTRRFWARFASLTLGTAGLDSP